jgi:hypothetical protein
MQYYTSDKFTGRRTLSSGEATFFFRRAGISERSDNTESSGAQEPPSSHHTLGDLQAQREVSFDVSICEREPAKVLGRSFDAGI